MSLHCKAYINMFNIQLDCNARVDLKISRNEGLFFQCHCNVNVSFRNNSILRRCTINFECHLRMMMAKNVITIGSKIILSIATHRGFSRCVFRITLSNYRKDSKAFLLSRNTIKNIFKENTPTYRPNDVHSLKI